MSDQPLTLGTAGHIDHGKTALVVALTGVDTDRLPQEKARGISIELGYAPLRLPSGRRLSVVDVPGHERFVRTMVAGATGIDAFLLVVACDDGVMPQTLEHLAIVRLLGIRRGVVALTKRDLADDDMAQLVRAQVAELLPGTPAVEVSARTGLGLDELLAALDGAAAGLTARSAAGPVRLPIDRSFTLRGIGTVVTGTLWSGTVRPQMTLAIQPGPRRARVRSVQVHDRPVEEARAGQRVAVSLAGIERSQVRRGQVLLEPGTLRPSYRLDCELTVLPGAPRNLRSGERVTVHHATSELLAAAVVRDAAELEPGATGRVQLRLQGQVLAAPGDRVIVRLTAPQTTIAGGRVLDPAPPRTPTPPARGEPPAEVPAPRLLSPDGAEELYARLAAEPLSPSPLTAAEHAPAAYLADRGRVVRAGRDLAFTAEAFDRAARAAVDLAATAGTLRLADLRDHLGISRRYAQAILEALDAQGVTRRVGDERVLRRRGRELAGG